MSRLRHRVPAELSATERALYEAIAHGPRSLGPQHFALTRDDGSLTGPFNALLLSPPLGNALQALGAAVRYETTMTARTRELAILVVAAHWNSAFERMAHEAVGRAAGLAEEELAAVASGAIPLLADDHERAAIRLVHSATRGDLTDDQWAEARAVLTEEQIFELITLVGYYAALALQLRIFRVDQAGTSPSR